MPSGPTPPAPMWRSAGWASTTATFLPPASTHQPPTNATVRGDTQATAHCTATKRKSFHLTCVLFFFYSSIQSYLSGIQTFPNFSPPTVVTMNVVRASVAEAHDLSANVLWDGRLILQLWFWVAWSVMWTVAATSTLPALLRQGSVTNARVRMSDSRRCCFINFLSVIF